ncbi:hypothetical protein J7T55_004089 [Diaporthe amygdali]|uniref:uncharacterized protein n=1 Tax=Phomopsis amygdali TaxID=1214568 RepID=UPI0022FEF294|nr:uncharacterized protein J7T55_004089 [Diaporthe amygdali]KAJ0115920.1 hypothetical protein J7T55_004089 [Diaporthe amygdali]
MSSMLPFLEVSNLAASSSFYSTVTHPLGLRYISAASPSPDIPGSPSIVYGIATLPPLPVFELRQVRPTSARPLKLSRIVFSAASPGAVRDFRALVQRIKGVDSGAIQVGDYPEPEESSFGAELVQSKTGADPTETDLDGNIIKMEVVYVPPVQDYPEWYGGSTVRKTQSTHSEASRILHWNYDVACDSAASMSFAPLAPASPSLVSPRQPGRYDERPSILRRSVTTTTTLLEPMDPTESPSQSSHGLSAVGAALMGVAAGAALGAGITYGVVRGSQGFEQPMAQRRSTFPRPYPDSRSPREGGTSVADRRPPPTLMSRHSYSQAPPAGNRDAGVDYDDARSRRSRPSGAPSIRTRSELSTNRKPLLLTDVGSRSHASSRSSARTGEMEDVLVPDHRSHTSSRHTSRSSKHPPSVRRSSTYDVPEGDGYSYVSAASHRTQSTVRGPPAAQSEHASRAASKANSRMSAATPRRPDSYVSARRVPLPASGAGSSYADDDLESLAPSDSISCVGIPRSERLYQ